MTHQPGFFFYKNGCSSGTESRKWLLRWEMNDLSKGYKQSVDQNWGRVVKIGFFGQKLRFRAQKKTYSYRGYAYVFFKNKTFSLRLRGYTVTKVTRLRDCKILHISCHYWAFPLLTLVIKFFRCWFSVRINISDLVACSHSHIGHWTHGKCRQIAGQDWTQAAPRWYITITN